MKINKFIKIIFILSVTQLFISVFNLIVYGQVEGRIGTLALAFGSLATVYPLTIMAFIMSYYLIISRKIRWLFFSFTLLIIGLASGKRALIITLPLLMFLFLSIAVKLNIISTKKFISKYIFTFAIGLIIALPIINFYFTTTNFGQGDSFAKGSVSNKVEQIFNFARDYEQSTDGQGYSRGRTGSNLIILNSIYNNEGNFWGIGPMELYDEDTSGYGSGYTPMGILYGIVGWGRDTLSIGFVSVFFIIWYILLLLRKFMNVIKLKNEAPNIILFIALGSYFSLFVFIFDYFFYSENSMISGFPLFLITISAGIIERFQKQKI